ncbi:RhuM family protein [Sulfurimonas sp.]|uniref:RhuM family protein n=1 Tax=Sulfurimonas sp. TaxID=2022749 RepID=UPI0025E84791|nr:RhuM family protein [Sulfurimonas sp.]MDD5158233.1 RhuM family protein [Sulfurimonas sp.]
MIQNKNSQILIYQTEDGKTKIETKLQDETVWLTQTQLCELFQKSKSTISEHIKNIFEEGELIEDSVVRKFRTTAQDGKNYNTNFYNLDVIISVGYRVKSLQGTKFRQWATQRLKEYIVKGFTMNDELLKNGGKSNYFEELLSRIRDIRSSEKIFWAKVLDIYATSIDYDPKDVQSTEFFQAVQNKMHWAVHGNTAAEVIYKRADSTKVNMGLTHFQGAKPTKHESEIAKNYLDEKELEMLNRMVTAYIEIAEIQAMNQTPMYMKDWIARLDDFLKMTGKNILDNAGTISHKMAIEKANLEYETYKEQTKDELSKAEKNFIEYIDETAKLLKNSK